MLRLLLHAWVHLLIGVVVILNEKNENTIDLDI